MAELIDHAAVIALAEERHFGRAARRLRISQPALTARLRRLETTVGARLFHRGRGGVSLTDAGAAFLESARRVLEADRDASLAAQAAQAGIGTSLTIGFTQIAAYQGLPKVFARFRAEQPSTRLSLQEGTTAVLERDLEKGHLDAAFMHPPLHAPGLAQRIICAEPLVTWTLHEDGRGLHPIMLPRDKAPVLRTEVDRLLQAPGSVGGGTLHDADTLIGTLVLAGAGYGPALALDSFPSAGFTVLERDNSELVELKTAVVWRARDRRAPLRSLIAATDAIADPA